MTGFGVSLLYSEKKRHQTHLNLTLKTGAEFLSSVRRVFRVFDTVGAGLFAVILELTKGLR
jgi:hypothetical protein